jgi:AraC-like DNA-binding protein
MSEEKPPPPIPRASLAPGIVPADQLPLLWRDSIAPYFDARPVADAEGPQRPPEIHQFNLGQVLLAESRYSAQTYDRDPHWMRRHDESDHLLLQLFIAGENRASNGLDDFVQRAGNVCAVNLAYQARSVSSDAHVLTLVLPRDLLRDELPHLLDRRGALFAPDSAAALLCSDYLLSLRKSLDRATAEDAPMLARTTLALLDSLTSQDDLTARTTQPVTFQIACRYIDQHLGDPDLGVDAICRHLRFSRATLYRLFHPHGGVHEHIRRRRLIACFKAITSPEHRHRRIFDIALDFGFTAPSHFSHVFRAHFGMTPREARDAGPVHFAASPPPGIDGEDAVSQMWSWAKTLTGRSRP